MNDKEKEFWGIANNLCDKYKYDVNLLSSTKRIGGNAQKIKENYTRKQIFADIYHTNKFRYQDIAEYIGIGIVNIQQAVYSLRKK
jgi:hypothetical protein